MIFNDLREYLAEVERRNDVKVIEGADWNLEILPNTLLPRISSEPRPGLLWLLGFLRI